MDFLRRGRGGVLEAPQNLKKCIKLIWNFAELGGVVLEKNPFHAGSKDIFMEPHIFSSLSVNQKVTSIALIHTHCT